MEIRQATSSDTPFLKQKLSKSGGEQIDLDTSRIWVAVEKGEIVGMLAGRMVWQLEPMLVWSGNKMTDSRACYGMFAHACKWLGDRTQNKTGIYWFFFITRSKAVKDWAKHSSLSLYRIYKGAQTFVKYL